LPRTGERVKAKKNSEMLLFIGFGAATALLSCCCLGSIGVGAFYFIFVVRPKDKGDERDIVVARPKDKDDERDNPPAAQFPLEKNGRWTGSEQKTKIPNPLLAHKQIGFVEYMVRFKGGTTYEIRLNQNGGDSDPYLVLEQLDGAIIAQDDDGGGFPNAKVLYTPEKDSTYRIRAATVKGTGDFTLIIRETKFKGGGSYEACGNIIFQDKGPWTRQDRIHEVTRSPAKTYRVVLKAGKIYIIDMVKHENSQAVCLILANPAGKMIVKDDVGNNPSARILYGPVQEGEYQITATTTTQSVGGFTLTVWEK
jgi:hypothetical protein